MMAEYRRIGRLLLVAVTALLTVGVMAACGTSNGGDSTGSGASTSGSSASTSSQATSDAKVKTVAIATPEKANDFGWNQQGVEGARAATKATGTKLIVADGLGYDNTESNLRQLVQQGADLVIAHASGYSTVAPRVAQQSKVPFLLADVPGSLEKGLVSYFVTASQDGAYLAGVLAARMTKTGTVGVVTSATATENFNKEMGGFISGVQATDPKVKILLAAIGEASYSDAAGGKRVAASEIANGADVIFGCGDGASFGYLQAAETAKDHKTWFIDITGDKSSVDKKGVLLSSNIVDYAQIFEQAIKDVDDGTFGTHSYNITLETGVHLLKTPAIPDDVWSDVQSVRKKIIDGGIKVPVVTRYEQVQALVKGNGS